LIIYTFESCQSISYLDILSRYDKFLDQLVVQSSGFTFGLRSIILLTIVEFSLDIRNNSRRRFSWLRLNKKKPNIKYILELISYLFVALSLRLSRRLFVRIILDIFSNNIRLSRSTVAERSSCNYIEKQVNNMKTEIGKYTWSFFSFIWRCIYVLGGCVSTLGRASRT
jgi:hypothetical protein